MKVIVTGFNAFADFAYNPSQEAVSQLPDFVKFDDEKTKLRIAKITLPTCCLEAWEVLSKEVESEPEEKFAIVLSGLADTRDKICLERFALNVRQFRVPDNNGHQWDEEHIHPHGPDALRSKLPLREICMKLNENGFAADISNHAGSYVCNETYYRSLLRWQDEPRCAGILFVHVPPYESYKHTNPEKKDERHARSIYADALKLIVESFAGY